MTRVLCGLLLLASLACGDAAAPATITGSYTLQSIGGTALPATVVSGGSTVTFTAGSAQFNSDLTFSESLTGSSMVNGSTVSVTSPFSGTYVTNGGAVVMTYSNTAQVTGTWTGSTLSVVEDGYALVYVK